MTDDNQVTSKVHMVQVCHIEFEANGQMTPLVQLMDAISTILKCCNDAEVCVSNGPQVGSLAVCVTAPVNSENCDKTQLQLALNTQPWRWE